MSGTVRTDGKFFAVDGKRFTLRGWHSRVAPDNDPPAASLRDAGFTTSVVESFDPILLSSAAEYDLHVLGEIRLPPWRAFKTASRRQTTQLLRSLAARLVPAASAMRGDPHLVGAMLTTRLEPGAPPPPPNLARRVLNDLTRSIHDLDAGLLVGAWLPEAAPECPIELDFLITSPEPQKRLSTALAEAHLLVGDRPLVLHAGEPALRFDASSYRATVDVAAAQGAAGTIVVGDAGGPLSSLLATADSRSVIARSNHRTVADLEIEWPAVSVVVCAYNAAETLDECLRNVALLDYPRLEVIVVDDGSVDETAEIAGRHLRVRLVRLDHAGLSEARNVGFREATGELVAYLDADAYPPPEWVRFLVLGSFGDRVVASGGPNVPPLDDPPGAQVVAHSPGAPVPILYRADRALHIPGCNMAFRRQVLDELGGFDPDLTSAEDTDLQLRIREQGLELGYHSAALVWHRRRPGVRTYLSQQRSYGGGQALAAVRNPEYFHHHRRHKVARALGRATTQEPPFIPVAYRSLWWRRRHVLDLAHQWGVPAAIAVVATAPLGLARRVLTTPAAVAGASVACLFGLDVVLAVRDLQRQPRRRLTALQVAALQLLRPLAFVWGTLSQAARLRLRQARLGPGYR